METFLDTIVTEDEKDCLGEKWTLQLGTDIIGATA